MTSLRSDDRSQPHAIVRRMQLEGLIRLVDGERFEITDKGKKAARLFREQGAA